MIIHAKCPTCGKVAQTISELKVGDLTIRTLQCKHVQLVRGAEQSDTLDVTALNGNRPFKFQIEGGRFAERANFRVLIADEMGLGKTIQGAICLVAHPEIRPFAVIAKAGLRTQWNKQLVNWGDFLCQIVEDSRTKLLPGFDGYILSYDMLRRFNGKMTEMFEKCKVKTLILDECQAIKNTESKRTQEVQALANQCEHIIALSGTPIKNHAGEYFPILNILRPDKFPRKNQFVYGWCQTYYDGYKTVTEGLKNPKAFMDFTKDFIIRRERAEVLPDLPHIFRQFTFHELGDQVEDAYKATFKEFQDYYNNSGADTAFQRSSNILAYLSKMRHLSGLAIVDPVCEWVQDFVETTDRKLVIFVHHKDVGYSTWAKLNSLLMESKLNPNDNSDWGSEILQLTADLKDDEGDKVMDKFWSKDCRIMIASTLAAGEGRNMQCCADCIIMERQWNPANEEQAEARFPRPGQTADKISAMYPIATGTVVEYFSELVEKKRAIMASTLSGKQMKWDESSLVRELASVLAEKGGRKWGW